MNAFCLICIADFTEPPLAFLGRRYTILYDELKFGTDGYVAVVDSGMHSVMNPSKLDTEGKYLGDYRDEKGNYVYRRIASIAKGGGEGVFEYYTHRPGKADIIRKRSYVKSYAPWDWVFVTGAYVEDIDAAFEKSISVTGVVVLAVGLTLAWVVVLINRSLVKSLGGSPECERSGPRNCEW